MSLYYVSTFRLTVIAAQSNKT